MLRNKKLLILTSILILLPVLVGVLMWNLLPAEIPTHWNAAGEIDGWSAKAFAVFGLPGFLFVVHWVCILATRTDPKNYGNNEKLLWLVLWICPGVSVLGGLLMYGGALGYDFGIEIIMPLLLGAMFIVIGNYLPKCKQNYTMGIKLPWTLHDEENWNRTHRLAGKMWVIGGVVLMLSAALRWVWFFVGVVAVLVVVPTVYSWRLYRKKLRG